MDAILKNAVISARIAHHMNAGMAVDKAIDEVLGAGTYAKIAAEAYEKLRAKAGK